MKIGRSICIIQLHISLNLSKRLRVNCIEIEMETKKYSVGWKVQLNPALTDFIKLTNLILLRRILLQQKKQKKNVEGTMGLYPL